MSSHTGRSIWNVIVEKSIAELKHAKITFLVTFVGVFSVVRSELKYQCTGKAQYSLSFYGKWSNETPPNAFPVGGKFSPLVGCSHNS